MGLGTFGAARRERVAALAPMGAAVPADGTLARGRGARAPAPSSRARAVDLDAPLAEGPPPLGGPSSGGGGGAAFGSGFGGAAAFGGVPGGRRARATHGTGLMPYETAGSAGSFVGGSGDGGGGEDGGGGGGDGDATSSFAKGPSERDVAEAVCRRAAEAERDPALGLLGSGASNFRASRKALIFLVALALASAPAAHRVSLGRDAFGGRERVSLCVDQLMPESVASAIGFSKCSSLVAKELEEARAERDAMLANGTYALAPPAPGVGEGAEVEDLILASSDASGVGSVAGRVIVAGGMLWTSLTLYAAFAIMRWIASLAAAHELRARFFAACSDPSEAALADVPYLNLRHAALPWLRVRAHLQRRRALELRWVELAVAHAFALVCALVLIAGVVAARQYTSPYQDSDAVVPACLALALAFSLPLAATVGAASRIKALQDDDETLARDEMWKISLDGGLGMSGEDGSTRFDSEYHHASPGTGGNRPGPASGSMQSSAASHALRLRRDALADLADAVARRNAVASPRALGFRATPGIACAFWALHAFALFAFLGVLATELAGGPYEGASVDQLRAYVEANFAYSHKFSETLLERVDHLADNVTWVQAKVTDANHLISTLDNTSPRRTLELVEDLSACMDCAADDGSDPEFAAKYGDDAAKARPWFSRADRNAMIDGVNRHFWRRPVPWSEACPAENAPAWCGDVVTAPPRTGAEEAVCSNLAAACQAP